MSSKYSTIDQIGEMVLANAVYSIICDIDYYLTFNFIKSDNPNVKWYDIEHNKRTLIITKGRQRRINVNLSFHIEAMIKYQQCQESEPNSNGIKSFKHTHSIASIYENKLSDSFKTKLKQSYIANIDKLENQKHKCKNQNISKVIKIAESLYKLRYIYFTELDKSNNIIENSNLQPEYNTGDLLALLIALYETTGLKEKAGIDENLMKKIQEQTSTTDGKIAIPI